MHGEFRKLTATNQSTLNPPQLLSKTDKSKTQLLCAIVQSPTPKTWVIQIVNQRQVESCFERFNIPAKLLQHFILHIVLLGIAECAILPSDDTTTPASRRPAIDLSSLRIFLAITHYTLFKPRFSSTPIQKTDGQARNDHHICSSQKHWSRMKLNSN